VNQYASVMGFWLENSLPAREIMDVSLRGSWWTTFVGCPEALGFLQPESHSRWAYWFTRTLNAQVGGADRCEWQRLHEALTITSRGSRSATMNFVSGKTRTTIGIITFKRRFLSTSRRLPMVLRRNSFVAAEIVFPRVEITLGGDESSAGGCLFLRKIPDQGRYARRA